MSNRMSSLSLTCTGYHEYAAPTVKPPPAASCRRLARKRKRSAASSPRPTESISGLASCASPAAHTKHAAHKRVLCNMLRMQRTLRCGARHAACSCERCMRSCQDTTPKRHMTSCQRRVSASRGRRSPSCPCNTAYNMQHSACNIQHATRETTSAQRPAPDSADSCAPACASSPSRR